MVGERTEVLTLIPVRAGSEPRLRKNVHRLWEGRVTCAIAAARAARLVTRIVVSTDNATIAEVARRHGADAPFPRPAELARDDTPDVEVVVHALEWLEAKEGYEPEIIVHLRPISPFCQASDIDRGIELLMRHPEADSVRMLRRPFQNPFHMWQIGADGFLVPLLDAPVAEPYNQPPQNLPSVFWQHGVDFARRPTILDLRSMTGRKILPLVCTEGTREHSLDIDADALLRAADWLVETGEDELISLHRPLPEGVRLLVLDFDGVMTDNRVWISGKGEELVAVSRSDGLGIAMLRQCGIEVLVLSSEASPLVDARCRKLQVLSYSGLSDKRSVLLRVLADRGLKPDEVIYLGNDVNDLGCMELVGFRVAVQDAHPKVLEQADLVLSRRGGYGAVRQLCDRLIELKERERQWGG